MSFIDEKWVFVNYLPSFLKLKNSNERKMKFSTQPCNLKNKGTKNDFWQNQKA